MSERTTRLHVLEGSSGNVVAVLGDPLLVQRTDAQNDAGTITDAAGLFDEFHPVPRRRESFKRTGAFVPAENNLRGGGHLGAADELLVLHGGSPEAGIALAAGRGHAGGSTQRSLRGSR